MRTECYPVSILPQQSRLFLDYVEKRDVLAPFFPIAPFAGEAGRRQFPGKPRLEHGRAAAALLAQQPFNAAPKASENVERLRNGAAAIVTGQQVGLLGGPLLTLLKAATAVRLARDLSDAGEPHVPIFWMATEDHDFEEVNHVLVPSRHALHRLQLRTKPAAGQPVGNVLLGDSVRATMEEAAELLGGTAFFERLEGWYSPGNTMAQAFGAFIAHVFAAWGLLVIDASTSAAHAIGKHVLLGAIARADELHHALLARNRELLACGYHAQVQVAEEASLLFLVEAESGARLPLRRSAGRWKAGARMYDEAELLAMVDEAPERLSPNALLRPVFQDALLPTTAYVGGPAEIAYFAQSQVLYERLLGRTTPILPRLSATLIEPSIATVMARHEVSLPRIFAEHADLAQRLGARAIPVQGKQKLAATGKALDNELRALTEWMAELDEGLGRAASLSASKMRYQMDRLRRMAANYQLQRDESLKRHADALRLALFPERHPQERRIAGAYYLARHGEGIVEDLIAAADSNCPGHKAIWLGQ